MCSYALCMIAVHNCAVYNYAIHALCTHPVNELKLGVERYNLTPGQPEHLDTPEIDTPLTGTTCAI